MMLRLMENKEVGKMKKKADELQKKELLNHNKKGEKKDNPFKNKIRFHKDFDKGMRLTLCPDCGYPTMFMGAECLVCSACSSCDVKVYTLDKLEDFVLKQQEIIIKREARERREHKKILKKEKEMLESYEKIKRLLEQLTSN